MLWPGRAIVTATHRAEDDTAVIRPLTDDHHGPHDDLTAPDDLEAPTDPAALGQRRGAAIAPLVAVFTIALAVRLYDLRTAYNMFIDEVTYATIGRNLASGDGLSLYGSPFNLHPPVVFAVLATPIRALGLGSRSIDQLVLDLRPVTALFGAGTVVVCWQILRLCGASRWVLVAATAVLVIDPFAVYFDSRVMLEAYAQFFVASSVLLLLLAMRGGRGRHIVAAGIAGGFAACSKETFGLVLLVSLLVLLFTPHVVSRRIVRRVLAVGVVTTAAITVAVWSTSGFAPWWHAHTSGLSRLLGTTQITGFNAASTKVTLASRLTANLDTYAATYVLLGAGGVACLAVLARRRIWLPSSMSSTARAQLVLCVWAFAACVYLAYATLFGSIEEQMYYIPLAPCVLVLATVWTSTFGGLRALLPRIGAVVAVVLVAFGTVVWIDQRTSDHDTYAQFFGWSRRNLPEGSAVAVSEDIAQFALKGVTIGQWTSINQWREHRADFVLVSSNLVDQGYSDLTPATLTFLRANAPVAFSATSSDTGTLYLFNIAAISRR